MSKIVIFQTVISFRDYFGNEIEQRMALYSGYIRDDRVLYEENEFIVKDITINETDAIKWVNAYSSIIGKPEGDK